MLLKSRVITEYFDQTRACFIVTWGIINNLSKNTGRTWEHLWQTRTLVIPTILTLHIFFYEFHHILLPGFLIFVIPGIL